MPTDLTPLFVTGAFTLVASLAGGFGGAMLAQKFQTKREAEIAISLCRHRMSVEEGRP